MSALSRILLAALAASLLIAVPAQARLHIPQPLPPVAHNPANALLREPIEPFAYDPATHCDPSVKPGMVDLEHWLQHHVRGSFWGSYRCEKWGKHSASLHAENRAVDWHLSVHSAADRRAAAKLARLLLAPDRAGNPQALARRMGVEELIWDCGYWSIGMPGFERYSVCFGRKGKRLRGVDDTTAHRDHIHIGMTKAGARGRTSFWRGR
jgi:hypothetical protein